MMARKSLISKALGVVKEFEEVEGIELSKPDGPNLMPPDGNHELSFCLRC
jgi:hypothetical protein